MRKLFVLLAVTVASVSVASAQDWGIGARAGSGFQVVGQKYFANSNYLEARLGMTFLNNAGFDASLLHYWNAFNWDWTPGNWFLDIGAGANIGARRNYLFLGLQGSGKFGYTFERTPLSLSLDLSPAIGPEIGMKKGYDTDFDWERGLFSSGFSAVFRF